MRQLGPSKFPSRRMPVSNVSFRLASLAAVAGFRRAGRSLRIGYLSRLATLWIQRGLGVGDDSWPPARLAKPSIIISGRLTRSRAEVCGCFVDENEAAGSPGR